MTLCQSSHATTQSYRDISETRGQIHLASCKKARFRQQSHFSTGDIVYFWRSSKSKVNKRGSYHGPTRVIAVEPPSRPDSNARSVIWLAHGQTLVQAAPEHLRIATPVEYNIETMINGNSSRDITRNLKQATGSSH